MLGIRQRLLLSRLRSGDWLPVSGRELPAAQSLARRGLIEYQPAHGVARAVDAPLRATAAAGLMRAANDAPSRPRSRGEPRAGGQAAR